MAACSAADGGEDDTTVHLGERRRGREYAGERVRE